MDYKQIAADMLIDLGNNYSQESHTELLGALGTALSKVLALIPDHDRMHFVMGNLLDSIEYHACREQSEIHGEPEMTINFNGRQITFEQYLRDVFQPDHKND